MFHVSFLLNLCEGAYHIAYEVKNIVPDTLSRRDKIFPTEWMLHKGIVFQNLGRPLVDLFATSLNYQLTTYVSPVQDTQAWAVDALSISMMWAYSLQDQ
jgi:hypothetical protein